MKVRAMLEIDLTDKGFDVLKKEENKFLLAAITGYLHTVIDKEEIKLVSAKII